MKRLALSLAICGLGAASIWADAACPLPKHVVLVGLDGLSGKCMREQRPAPFLSKMAAEGVWQFDSRSIMPSSSAANWASLFQAAGPELTGYLTWNAEKPAMPPPVVGSNGRFPDVVSELRAQRPKSRIGYFYEWKGMAYVLDTNSCDVVRFAAMTNGLCAAAADWFRAELPALTILAIDHPDAEGHSSGWGSEAYVGMVRRLDDEVRRLYEAVKAAGALDETVFIVTSDHGGIRKGHGGKTMDEMERPLLIWGKGVKRGQELKSATGIYDVGATMAWLLGLRRPQAWTGRPLVEAFEGNEARDDNAKPSRGKARAKHVVFCGFDGLSGACFRRGVAAPTFRRLMSEGAWTLKSRAVLPSSSCCNWATIFLCAGPEFHGCDAVSNPLPAFRPVETLKDTMRFPDVFHQFRRAYGGDGRLGFFYEWGGVFRVVEPISADVVVHGSNLRDVADSAADFFLRWRPQLMSVVFNEPDGAGHSKGWESPEYDMCVEKLDARFKRVYAAVEKSGALPDTVFILSSDHGGIARKHGGNTLEEVERPLVIWGRGVKKNFEITEVTASYDVGATIAWILGVEPAQAWRGRPVTSAFVQEGER